MNSNKALALSKSSSSRSSSPVVHDWAWLPLNVIILVLNKLFLLSDMFRVASVCRHWRSAAKCMFEEMNLRANMHFNRNHPMLLVPSTENDAIRNVYSVVDKEIYDLRLPVPYTRRYCGSSHGWLIFLDDQSFEITLVNPFYFGHEKGIIKLPPFVAAEDAAEETSENFQCEFFVTKAVLSADPTTSPDDYALLLIHGEMRLLAVWKSGATHWGYVNWHTLAFNDIIFSDDRFFAVNDLGEIYVLEINTTPPTFSYVYSPALDGPEGNCRRYIVELPDGTIQQVIRLFRTSMRENEVPAFYTSGFVVFRLRNRYEGRDWVQVSSLSEGAFFLGNNHSKYVDALQFPGCRPNSVYFVDDIQDHDTEFLSSYQITCRRDIGVYHLDDYILERIDCPLPMDLRLAPPIWIDPTI